VCLGNGSTAQSETLVLGSQLDLAHDNELTFVADLVEQLADLPRSQLDRHALYRGGSLRGLESEFDAAEGQPPQPPPKSPPSPFIPFVSHRLGTPV
jgi:hypothetical protein